MTRICQYRDCQKPLERRPDEKGRNWEMRRYCDQACNRAEHVIRARETRAAQALAERVCRFEGCHKAFSKPPEMNAVSWSKQRYCSSRCKYAAKRYPKPLRAPTPKTPVKEPVKPPASTPSGAETPRERRKLLHRLLDRLPPENIAARDHIFRRLERLRAA